MAEYDDKGSGEGWMKVEQQAQAYLLASAMHRAERTMFDACEALTNAIGQKLEGRGREKDVAALREQFTAAEQTLWSTVGQAMSALN
jgi:hypothetical protein